jgi:hypothetical protein
MIRPAPNHSEVRDRSHGFDRRVPRSINELGDAAALRLIPAKSIPKRPGRPSARYADATEGFASCKIETTRVSVPKHFEHSKVRESKPGLSGSMTRSAIFSSHFGHLGLLIWSTRIAYPPFRSNQPFGGGALRISYVRKVTDVWKSDG